MLGQALDLRRRGTAVDGDWDTEQMSALLPRDVRMNLQILLGERPEAWRDWVNDLLVQSPEGVPLQRDDVLRRSLGNHELTESLNGQSATTDSAHGGEARVIPAPDKTLVDKPVKLALGQEGVNEVETTNNLLVRSNIVFCRRNTYLKSQMYTGRMLSASIIQ